MKQKIFSNAILGSGIPSTPTVTLFATNSTSDRVYRMTQPGSWWLTITPASNWIHEILAIELRIVAPSPTPDRILKQYRYIQRRSFVPRRHVWANTVVVGAPVSDRYAAPNSGTTTLAITETQRTTAPFEPYRQATSFGPFWIHSYIQADPTPVLYHIVGGSSFPLPAIGPAASPTYYTPDAARVGNEPRHPLQAFFTLAGGEELRIRVRGFNHDVSRLPGFTDSIPIDCEPAADEIGAAWSDNNPPFGERPGFFLLPITL